MFGLTVRLILQPTTALDQSTLDDLLANEFRPVVGKPEFATAGQPLDDKVDRVDAIVSYGSGWTMPGVLLPQPLQARLIPAGAFLGLLAAATMSARKSV